MKIAFITSTYFPHMGGAEVFLHNLILSLQKEHGVKVCLYLPYSFYRHAVKNGIKNRLDYELRALPPFLFRLGAISQPLASHFLSREQAREHYDLWHATFAWPSGYLLRDLKGVKRLLRCPGEDIQTNETLGYGMARDPKLAKKIEQTLDAMDALVAMSGTTLEAFSQKPAWRAKTRLIPNGIPTAHYQSDKEKIIIKRQLGLPANKKCLLTVGRNHPKKGFSAIPEMVKGLLKKRDDFIWVVIGKDCSKLLEGMEAPVRQHLVILEQQGVAFEAGESRIGYLPNRTLTAYYQAADIFVFPSLFESFGIVLTEAMAAGLAIVTTDAPGCRDLVKDNYNGLSVACGNFTKMTEALECLMDDHALALQLGQKAKEKAVELYDLTSVSAKYAALYSFLIYPTEKKETEAVLCRQD